MAHNERLVELDYNYPDLIKNNESWIAQDIDDREKEIRSRCKQITGRKMQKNAEPIREAVVNLEARHTLEDLKRLAANLKASHGIECFQIHIHRDEGKSRSELNYHAHMLFDWQDKETGKTMKLNRADLSKIQTLVASTLDMDRGELKENSNRERLEAVEYKRQQEEQRLQELQAQVEALEQKKNRAAEANRKARAGHSSFEELATLYASEGVPQYNQALRSQDQELNRAIELQSGQAARIAEETQQNEGAYRSAAQDQIKLIQALKQHEQNRKIAKRILEQREQIKALEYRLEEARKGQG